MTAPARPVADVAADPYFYGWRFVARPRPDGTVERVQVPLTAEDVLHPQEEDFIVQTSEHQNLVHSSAASSAPSSPPRRSPSS